jgi:hypothetical protein
MHKIFLLVLTMFFITTANAQTRRVKRQGVTPIQTGASNQSKITYTYKADQFKGKWQEVKRFYKNQQPASIVDTVFLFFKGDNKAETRDGTKTFMKGDVMIETPGNILVVAADVYTIISVSKDTIVLDDQEEFVHTLVKVEKFWHETVGKVAIVSDAFDNPVNPSIQNLMGNWGVYRRQSKPGALDAGTLLIKHLKIKEAKGANTATGEITVYTNQQSEQLSCTVTINGTNMLIKTEKQSWIFPVYKADGKELVFGDKSKLIYFAKPL